MTATRAQVVTVGEVVIEMARGADGRFSLGSGGDTFSTAIYLARAGVRVSHATALGDDPYSDRILSLAAAEGIGRDLVLRVAGRRPGVVIADIGPAGASIVHDWGEAAPARLLFDLPDWTRVASGLLDAGMIYFSGITLSRWSNTGLGRFLATVELARRNGAKVVFDGNFRPEGWTSDLGRTRSVFMEALKRVDIALPTFGNEARLWGDASPEATASRLQAFGIAEIVVKNGPNSALVAATGRSDEVPVPEIVVPIDPTAGGDGFNAGYLAARIAGRSPTEAVAAAHRLAAQVIRHRGAILPRSDMAMH